LKTFTQKVFNPNIMNKFIEQKKADFEEALEFFKKDISTLRTGRANPSVLDGVFVDAYGAKTPLTGVASINVSDARSLVVQPWDKSLLKDIEKAVVEADLGLGTTNEGERLRLTVPMMTEENRKDLVKKLNEKMEKTRVSFKKTREEIKEDIEKAFTAKEIPEDDKFKFIKELDDEIRSRNESLKETRDKKEAEIMTI
jgi:ribosome recycling factor